jgi:Protein of unknown function (DUF2799)
MLRRLPALALGAMLAACATIDRPDPSNLAGYCTPLNGYRLGYQSKAYFGGCPRETEGAFLAGLQRGRVYRANPPQALPYYERMEQTEKQLLAAASEPEREQLRERLREIEWWAIHIVTSPGTYSQGGSDR